MLAKALLGLATLAVVLGVGALPVHASTDADSIVVLVKHTDARPGEPVAIRLERFKVTRASFDPKKIEGGTATIEIDATSVKSGSDKTDARIQTPDFLDTAKYATITIAIDKVKKKTTGQTFVAEATVKFRAVTKKYPLTFAVVAQTPTSVQVKGEATLSRLDFKIGKPPRDGKGIATDVVVQWQLTFTRAK